MVSLPWSLKVTALLFFARNVYGSDSNKSFRICPCAYVTTRSFITPLIMAFLKWQRKRVEAAASLQCRFLREAVTILLVYISRIPFEVMKSRSLRYSTWQHEATKTRPTCRDTTACKRDAVAVSGRIITGCVAGKT